MSPTKVKKPQAETPNEVQGRDLFRTPRYAVEMLLPFIPKWIGRIWECACGEGHISKILQEKDYPCYSSDIEGKYGQKLNFLSGYYFSFDAIVTNPPFSIKQKFYDRCKQYNKPFALLIPADYSGWIIDAIRIDGCEKIVPNRRIDFITPTGKSGKDSGATFHSMWLTYKFNIGRTETFVDLTTDMKKNIL